VNSGVICGVVTRMMRKTKKPISAMVTAPMAAMRDAPSVLTNSTRPCTELHPLAPATPCAALGKICPVDG